MTFDGEATFAEKTSVIDEITLSQEWQIFGHDLLALFSYNGKQFELTLTWDRMSESIVFESRASADLEERDYKALQSVYWNPVDAFNIRTFYGSKNMEWRIEVIEKEGQERKFKQTFDMEGG